VNEILDAPFDAHHPVKRLRPLPSGRIRAGPLVVLTTVLGALTVAVAAWLFRPAFVLAVLALFVAGLLYNLPPLRLKDWPYLDAAVEALTNPIRVAIGWYAVSRPGAAGPPAALLVSVWVLGAFVMTGKRLAELRLLGAAASRYRPTFAAYAPRGLLAIQIGYGLAGVAMLARLFAAERPRLLATLPLVVALVAWTFRMTFEAESPLIDPEHLYRRPLFLLAALAALGLMLWQATG
jgi:4-hydroxybenzoate polyprenyltransferase